MMRGFHFRSPVAIPELGIEAGDAVDYHPSDPSGVYLIRRVPKARAMAVLGRYRSVARHLPGGIIPTPSDRPSLQLVTGGDDG